MMLAYVFWHWPRAGIAQSEYERHLRSFHQRMRDDPPAGMQRSLAWRVEGAPWLPNGKGYEDWYLLDSSSALDAIEHGAVSGSRQANHDEVASFAAGGTAGLYKPGHAGSAAEGNSAEWFSKPAGSSYSELSEGQCALGELWIRKMVLGPAPECLLLGDDVAVPVEWEPIHVWRTGVWPIESGR